MPHVGGGPASIVRGVAFTWSFDFDEKENIFKFKSYDLVMAKRVRIDMGSQWVFAVKKEEKNRKSTEDTWAIKISRLILVCGRM